MEALGRFEREERLNVSRSASLSDSEPAGAPSSSLLSAAAAGDRAWDRPLPPREPVGAILSKEAAAADACAARALAAAALP